MNGKEAILDNFLGALPIANIKPKRFLLQTGAKNYGYVPLKPNGRVSRFHASSSHLKRATCGSFRDRMC